MWQSRGDHEAPRDDGPFRRIVSRHTPRRDRQGGVSYPGKDPPRLHGPRARPRGPCVGVEEAATQVVGRDRYAEFIAVLANLAAPLEVLRRGSEHRFLECIPEPLLPIRSKKGHIRVEELASRHHLVKGDRAHSRPQGPCILAAGLPRTSRLKRQVFPTPRSQTKQTLSFIRQSFAPYRSSPRAIHGAAQARSRCGDPETCPGAEVGPPCISAGVPEGVEGPRVAPRSVPSEVGRRGCAVSAVTDGARSRFNDLFREDEDVARAPRSRLPRWRSKGRSRIPVSPSGPRCPDWSR